MKYLRALVFFTVLAGFAVSSAPLHAAPENTVVETKLPNGLAVLTKEVHAAPVVEVIVAYKVGSRNETVGETGMSHLLEHMMFKGTKTLKPGEIDRLFDLVGAENNAYTMEDLTAYHETLAADQLPLALRIESDRMVNSLFDPVEHKREMTVVRSELEGDENSPDTLLYQAVIAAAFQAHPYHWPVIGWRADVENVTRNEMYSYYKNWYEPNNAILVLVGDFKTDHALNLVRQYFGKLPARPIARHFITPEPTQVGERRVEVQREGTTPRTLIAYHIPRFGSPDYYALDVLSTLLSSGRSARLFQNLVETGLATSAYADDQDHHDPFLMMIGAAAQQGKTPEDLEKALLAEVEKLKTAPVTDAEMTRAKNQIEAAFTYERDSIPDQADTLGKYAAWGDWRYPDKYLPQIAKVTAADVQRAAQKYLTAENRTIGYFRPRPPKPGETAPDDSGGGPTHGTVHYRRTGESRESARAPIAVPPSQAAPKTPLLKTTRVVLPNDLVVLVRENHANPTVSIEGCMLSAGGSAETADKQGLASFTAGMLERGTRKRSSLEIAEALEDVGASVEVAANTEYLTFGGRSLKKDFARLLDVLSDELRSPSFPADQLEKLRSETLSALTEEAENPSARAERAFAGAVYPPGHPYWEPTAEAEAQTIKGFTREDLQLFQAAHYGPNTITLVVVGDVTPDSAVAMVKQYFGDWQKKDGLSIRVIPATLRQPTPRQIVIPMPDKSEVDVVYGYAGSLTRKSPDFYAARIVDWVLGGGSFGSRLMASLRDKQGLVYGAYSSFDAGLGAGPFTVSFGSNPANADKAVAEMRRQIAQLQAKGMTEEELNRAKSYLTGSYPIRLATNAGVASQLMVAEIFKLGLDYPSRYASLYRAVTLPQANAAARKYLDANVGTLVLAGPYSRPAANAGSGQKSPSPPAKIR